MSDDPKEPKLRDADTEPDDKAAEVPDVQETEVLEGERVRVEG